jgi:cytochrome c
MSLSGLRALAASLGAIAALGLGAVAAQEYEDSFGRGDINAGRASFNIECRSCHSLNAGQPGRGPSLLGIYGRRAGSDPGFAYSDPLKTARFTWTDETLNTYLRDPFSMGTQVNMIIHGIRDPQKRADLIAFLKHDAK